MLAPILIIFLLVISLPAFASQLDLDASVLVNTVTLDWKSVEGASWYDIYNGDEFIVRLGADENSYRIEHLDQNEDFRFVMGARDEDNATLDAEAVSVRTGSYEGRYCWINPTDSDNHGRLKDIVFNTALREDDGYGQYMEISIDDEEGRRHVIFPLQSFDSSWDWIDYDSDQSEAVAYRLNCERFNTMGINPSRFRVSSVNLSTDSISIVIVSRAFGISVETTSTYTFGVDEEGPYLIYSTTGNGLARSALFKNPADRENPYSYLLRPCAE